MGRLAVMLEAEDPLLHSILPLITEAASPENDPGVSASIVHVLANIAALSGVKGQR